jgi:hypothetical protein
MTEVTPSSHFPGYRCVFVIRLRHLSTYRYTVRCCPEGKGRSRGLDTLQEKFTTRMI